jgi:hypothetical protein
VQLRSADGPSFAVGVAALELLGDEDEEDEDQPSRRRGICRFSHDLPKMASLGSAGDAEDAYRGISEANMGHVTACDGM